MSLKLLLAALYTSFCATGVENPLPSEMAESETTLGTAAAKNPPPLMLFNSLTRKTEIFRPLVEGKVGMYVCGVTPYDFSHVGHARAYVAFDVLYRYVAPARLHPPNPTIHPTLLRNLFGS